MPPGRESRSPHPYRSFLILPVLVSASLTWSSLAIAWSRRMTSIRCSSWRSPMRIRVAMPNVLAVPPPSYALMSTRRWRRGYACSSFRWVARAAGQLHPAHRRRRVALAVRPLVPGVQVDHRVRGQHAFDSGQWIHDLERREWLDQDGWRMIIVVSEDIDVHPLRTLQRVKAALEDRGARVPKSFNQEWTRHFMVRA
jgi:transposase